VEFQRVVGSSRLYSPISTALPIDWKIMTEPATQWRSARNACAIIIGAAHGAGLQFAHHLAARGVQLLLVDRDEIALARVKQDTGGAIVQCDVLDERCVAEMFETAEAMFGHVDLLINAAGTGYVRTLGVMRASREFARRPRLSKAFIVNLAASPDSNGGPFEYAGSEVAFSRLADGLARAIENSELKVLTLGRISNEAEVADLSDQLLRKISGDRADSGGPAPAA